RVLSEAAVDFSAPGEYEVAFANVDDRLWLWIDGDEVEFPDPTYQPFGGQIIQTPTADDLTPVGIAAENLSATVSHLRVHRDVYYRAEFVDPATAALQENLRSHVKEAGTDAFEARLHSLADDPQAYGDLYRDVAPWLKPDRGAQYRLALGEGEYLLLGDNSPRSLDGRLWGNVRRKAHRHAVPREALVGKALMIFWPHGLRLGNEKNGMPHGWTVRGLERFFYHRTPDGRVVADYPAHGVPFYPDFERILRRIR
ncbi:MAG TPA: S26 family signal peptidase, partial [Planctomycetaceae bacterium]